MQVIASTPSRAPDAELARDLNAVLTHIHRDCNADLFEAVGALELSLTQMKLLHGLRRSDTELSLKTAAEMIHVSLAAASRLVDELARRGFIERREDATDRRVKRIRLTDEGRAVIARLDAARLRGLETFAATLSPSERAKLADAIATLLQRPDIAACRTDGAQI